METKTLHHRYRLWYGRDEPPRPTRLLRAGPVTALVDGRDLRQIRYGGLEIAQRVYVAIRDRNWNTVPGTVSHQSVDQRADSFRVTFLVHHIGPGIDISWRGGISGEADGTIVFAMDAVPAIDMTYKLVGLNVHHGMREYAGRPYEARTIEGDVSGDFPDTIAPQLIADGTEVPIFPPTEEVTVALTDGVTVQFVYDGDRFEFEDQRNWTDASFKSQSYPPRRNGLFHAEANQLIHQAVTIVPTGHPPPPPSISEHILVTIGEPTGQILPPIGFGMASHGGPLSDRELDVLRLVAPAHLRADLDLAGDRFLIDLASAAEACRRLGCGLELALFLDGQQERRLADLAAGIEREEVPVRRVLVFRHDEQATGEPSVALVRDALGTIVDEALFAGGTNANFCELNRHRPLQAPEDGIVYSINPQIHAFDERSLVENLRAQAETMATAQVFAGDRPIVISPVTLKQRFNAVATDEEAPPDPDGIPPEVDPRQASLFAAAWTIGSIKMLSIAGAASLTYYETTGWRGIIETDAGNPVPERFLAQPADLFPIYQVFADLAEWSGGALVTADTGDPLAVEVLAIRDGEAMHLLIANLTAIEQVVRIGGLPPSSWRLRMLDADTVAIACQDSPAFRRGFTPLNDMTGDVELDLPPFALARIDSNIGSRA